MALINSVSPSLSKYSIDSNEDVINLDELEQYLEAKVELSHQDLVILVGSAQAQTVIQF